MFCFLTHIYQNLYNDPKTAKSSFCTTRVIWLMCKFSLQKKITDSERRSIPQHSLQSSKAPALTFCPIFHYQTSLTDLHSGHTTLPATPQNGCALFPPHRPTFLSAAFLLLCPTLQASILQAQFKCPVLSIGKSRG